MQRRRLLQVLCGAAAAAAGVMSATLRATAHATGTSVAARIQTADEPDFRRFDEQALRVFFFARQAVSDVGGAYVTCAHLLMGVTHVDPALLNAVLAEGWDAVRLRARMAALLQTSPRPPLDADVPFSAGSLRALQRATMKLSASEQATPIHVFVSVLSERDELERVDALLREAGIRIPAPR